MYNIDGGRVRCILHTYLCVYAYNVFYTLPAKVVLIVVVPYTTVYINHPIPCIPHFPECTTRRVIKRIESQNNRLIYHQGALCTTPPCGVTPHSS